jgi:glycosyltransferase involved in cell wall biosynthesis
MNISALVITYNEEKNIGKCIDALFEVCDEVIVVDSNSKDETVAIAKEKGATVIIQPFLGDGPQRIHGVPFCKNDWILNLDADEYLDTDSIEFIKKASFFEAPYDAYSFRVKNFLQDKVIDFAGWYPDYKIRFFNKKTATPSEDKVHQKIIATNIKKLKTHILHYGSHSFFQIIAKKNQYAQWNAEQLYDAGKRVNSFKPVLNGLVSFIRCYFFKKGIINGIDGLTISLTQGYFSYIKYANLYQIQKERKNLK